MSASPCKGVSCSFSWECSAQNCDNRSIDVKEMLLPKCRLSFKFKFSFGMVTVADIHCGWVSIESIKRWVSQYEIVPLYLSFLFFRAIFHNYYDFLRPHYIVSTKYNSAFTETIWSSWVICHHTVLSFAKDCASACSSNVYRHLQGVNSVLDWSVSWWWRRDIPLNSGWLFHKVPHYISGKFQFLENLFSQQCESVHQLISLL